MFQTWGKLLFMHWPIPEHLVRPHIPERLQIDTYDGAAWIGVTPFTMWNVRPAGMPALPVVSSTHELNVRTYVLLDGVPGVWFFSLDASNPLAVLGARIGFALPYYLARMSLESDDRGVRFVSRRRRPVATEAALRVAWRYEERLPEARPGSRDDFLIERYCLYASRGGRLSRARIHHRPWPLQRASVEDVTSSMIEAQGLPAPADPPIIHAQAEPIQVGIWRPKWV